MHYMDTYSHQTLNVLLSDGLGVILHSQIRDHPDFPTLVENVCVQAYDEHR